MLRSLSQLLCVPATVWLLAAIAVPGTLIPSPAPVQAQSPQESDIRVPGDLCYWDRLSWSEMTKQEQELWTVLGWDRQRWEGDIPDYPETEDTEWEDLTDAEQQAAAQLGYDRDAWNTLTCD